MNNQKYGFLQLMQRFSLSNPTGLCESELQEKSCELYILRDCNDIPSTKVASRT